MRPLRLNGLPELMRHDLKVARMKRGWSQAKLGEQIGLPQMHISGIENGKIVPRFDTLIDLVRILDYDLLMVPRSLVPAAQALIRDSNSAQEEHSLYAMDEESTQGQSREE